MDNLNNGSVVDFNQINDYQKAAKDFAEGNNGLEQLLLNCFSKVIKTIACCGGHEDKNRKPYISFSYSLENEQYIYALISKLKDSGFIFRYNKLSNGNSFLSIEEGQLFDFSKASTLFNDINDVIDSFDMGKNYYAELPRDLQKYISIIKIAANDDFLKTDRSSEYFQMCYEKVHDGYEYSLFTSDPYYNIVAEKGDFTKISGTEMFPGCNLKVPNREMAVKGLNEIVTNIQTFDNKPVQKPNSQQSQSLKQKENELEIGFEYDERTRSNPLINHLRVNPDDTIETVAQKLIVCRERGINAFAVFNDIEVNNYHSSDSKQIIEVYKQSKNKAGEVDTQLRSLSEERIRENQQPIEVVEQDLAAMIREYQLEQLSQQSKEKSVK